jgi:hypothetical protein
VNEGGLPVQLALAVQWTLAGIRDVSQMQSYSRLAVSGKRQALPYRYRCSVQAAGLGWAGQGSLGDG